MNSQVGTKRNITMTKQWHLGGLSHNRLCDIVGNPIALNKCNKRWCGPFLFMCCKTNQLLSGFILNCNVQENNLYSKILTSYKLLSGHIYICIEIQQETTTCWLPREFSTSKAAFEGHVLNFGMNLFYQQISTFLEVPSPNDKWCQKIRPSGPAKKHLHKVSSLSFVPSVCKTTVQDFSTWKKKKNKRKLVACYTRSSQKVLYTEQKHSHKNQLKTRVGVIHNATWTHLDLAPWPLSSRHGFVVCCNIAPSLFLTHGTSWN